MQRPGEKRQQQWNDQVPPTDPKRQRVNDYGQPAYQYPASHLQSMEQPPVNTTSPFGGYPHFPPSGAEPNPYSPYFPPAQTAWFQSPPGQAFADQGYTPSGIVGATSIEQKPPNVDDATVFKQLNSCISIVEGTARKVKITIGELRRRTGAPEFMEANQLVRLTKHPKSNAREFERTFTKFGFDMQVNKGQSRSNGVISLLLEGEAIVLARDFNKLVSSEFPTALLAEAVVEAAGSTASGLLQQVPAIRAHLSCVRTYLLGAGREPDELVKLQKNGAAVDPAVIDFSLFTHGFGALAVVAVVESLMSLIGTIEKALVLKSREEESYLDDSGLGCSFQSEPSSPARTAAAQVTDFDALHAAYDDDQLAFSVVAPRIEFDAEPIKLTLAELRRRAHGPEKFTVSLMNNYLRKAKKSLTHSTLRKNLADQGITINSSKGLTPTSWSSLAEAEAIALASQTAHYFSFVPPSAAMRERTVNNPNAAAWLRFIVHTVQCSMDRVGRLPGEGIVETEVDKSVIRFALITHHFGHSFYASVMQWIQAAS